jgi:hypothetical protein
MGAFKKRVKPDPRASLFQGSNWLQTFKGEASRALEIYLQILQI